jgi:hypothetical protein
MKEGYNYVSENIEGPLLKASRPAKVDNPSVKISISKCSTWISNLPDGINCKPAKIFESC